MSTTPPIAAAASRVAARAASSVSVQSKLAHVRERMGETLIERDVEIDGLLTSLVANTNFLMVGEPGLGKSMLCDGLLAACHGSLRRFDYLFMKFSTPEDVFGPLSISDLKRDVYRRITKRRLPEVEIAFLDEIFKAGPAILNSMLKILNEKRFSNGDDDVTCPLLLAMAASNEWPQNEGAQELAPFFDRFLVRMTVRPITSEDGLRRLMFGPRVPFRFDHLLTLEDVQTARREALALPWAEGTQDTLIKIVTTLRRDEKVTCSDRRKEAACRVLAAYAYLNGRSSITKEDMEILCHVLWNDPIEQPARVAKVVAEFANPVGLAVNTLLAQIDEICRDYEAATGAESRAAKSGGEAYVKKAQDAFAAAGTASAKLKDVKNKLDALSGSEPRVKKASAYVARQISRVYLNAHNATGGATSVK